MSDEIYRKLAKVLDTLPNGFPATDDQLEIRLLSAIQYQANEVVLHTDTSLMPRSRRAWASWNYRVPARVGDGALVTYDMNRLQGITSRNRFLVTLNGSERIAPERVLRSFLYHHPVFDRNAITAYDVTQVGFYLALDAVARLELDQDLTSLV